MGIAYLFYMFWHEMILYEKGHELQARASVVFYSKFEVSFGQSFKSKLGVPAIQISIIKQGSSIDISPFLKLK